MRARCGRISRPLFENTLATGADETGMQKKTRISTWEVDTDHTVLTMKVSSDDTAYSDHCLALCDVSGFRKLSQNRNITTTRHTRI